METSIKIGSAHTLGLKAVSLTLAITFSIAYSLCVLYGFVFPSEMHTALFEMLPWVKWIDPASFVIGLTEFFIAGLFYGAIAALIYNYFIGRIR
jgi:hypothetical protein